jgi:hypothetical protein
LLIFDTFPDREQAIQFQAEVQRVCQPLKAHLCDDQKEFEKYDVFPWQLRYPVIVVERSDSQSMELKAEKLVKQFGGTFAGT